MIDWTVLRRKFGAQEAACRFEKLAFLYVQDAYPNYEWIPTPRKGDGNRDARVALDGDYEIWEEAKYRNGVQGPTHKRDRALERKDIDSTILSGIIYGKVRLIIFVSNADLPSSVMSRAMLGARIRNIEVSCAMAAQLESWLVQHKEIYEDIFELPFPTTEPVCPVINFQHVQFFDLISTDFLPLQQKKNFFTGELCMLELVVYTSKHTTASLRPLDVPFIILEHPHFSNATLIDLPAGLSSLIFLVRMERPHLGCVNINLEIDGEIYCRASNYISILAESPFRISYGNQLEIIHQIRQMLLQPIPYQQGLLITLSAESSMGKSYILRKLFQDFSTKYDISFVEFDSNENSMANYTLLCRIVLFLFYGNIFWDMMSSQATEINSFKTQILKANTAELFSNEILSLLIDGCFDSNVASKVILDITKRIKRENLPIVGGRRSKHSRILLLDDFQYLHGPQETFVKLLLKQLSENHNSNILVISATDGRFKNKAFEAFFQELTPNHFTLKGLTRTDKCETLCTAFHLPPESLTHVANQILPNSPLLAGEVLRIINSHLKGNPNPISVVLAYTEQIGNFKLLQNKFAGLENQFYLLDIIYKFKKGIPLRYLEGCKLYSKPQVQADIRLLLVQNLISIRNGIASPYHEYYISAYQQLRGKQLYNHKLGLFFEYLLTRPYQLESLDINQILVMLLRCGQHYVKTYKTQVKKYALEHIHNTQFGAALDFFQYYYELISPVGKRILTHEESYFLYLYADCLVHCDYLGRAYDRLLEVYQYAKPDSLEKYEAGASLLNQLFWRIHPEEVIADSFLIQKGIECLPKTLLRGENRHRMDKAYNSCLNRRMAAYLLKDDVKSAYKIYWERLKAYAGQNRKTFPTYSATIIMDYARGISFFHPEEGRRLMYLALKFFKSDAEHHYRRLLLCNVDVQVLDSIVLGQYDSHIFNDNCLNLLKSGFMSEYFKAVMKHVACKLIDYSKAGNGNVLFPPNARILRDIEYEIQDSLIVTQLQPNGRELLLMNYIKAFLSIKRGDLNQAKELLLVCDLILKEAGESYKIALYHNITHLEQCETIDWYTNQSKVSDNTYFIDCRFW